MKRITVDEAREAYRVTGLRPIEGDFVLRDADGTKCGCPATAVYLLRHPEDTFEHLFHGDEVEDGEEDGEPVYCERNAEHILEAEEYDYRYLDGFTRGFDGGSFKGEPADNSERYMGWEDGVAVREALLPEIVGGAK